MRSFFGTFLMFTLPRSSMPVVLTAGHGAQATEAQVRKLTDEARDFDRREATLQEENQTFAMRLRQRLVARPLGGGGKRKLAASQFVQPHRTCETGRHEHPAAISADEVPWLVGDKPLCLPL